MRLTETSLRGAFIVDIEPLEDERGFFARTFCAREFAAHGLKQIVAQCSTSFSARRGTLRGLHFQTPPSTEAKLVRCTRGAIHDVIVDLRPGSPTRHRHLAVELSCDNRRALYVPEMFAHGFQTLCDSVEVAYQTSEFYTPGCASGLRYDDPALGISWPLCVSVISEQDRSWPLLSQGG